MQPPFASSFLKKRLRSKLCHTHCRDEGCGHKFQTGELRVRVGGKWFCTSCVDQAISSAQAMPLLISATEVGGFESLSPAAQATARATLQLLPDGAQPAVGQAPGPRRDEYASDRPRGRGGGSRFDDEC